MFAFLSFLLVMLGCINWLCIGLLQYDFVAGIFGYQASIFSRLIYITVGIASIYLLFKAFKDKGKINIVNFKSPFKKKKPDEQAFATQTASTPHQMSGADYSENEPPPHQQDFPENNIFDDIS